MTNLEAASCGCKVVTYNVGGAPEAIDWYGNKVVLTGKEMSPEGLIRALRG